MAANLDPKTQALKLVVIVLGVLIVACLIVVVVTIYNRASEMADRPAELGTLSLGVEPMCEVAEVTAGEGRFYLRMAPAQGCPLVLILDARTGELLGRIER
jgi:hypothetical protein